MATSSPHRPSPPTTDAPALAVLEAAGRRADTALALASQLAAQMADADARVIRAEGRADQERLRADELRDRLAVAEEAAEALRRAEEARRALGRWARVRRAWKGE